MPFSAIAGHRRLRTLLSRAVAHDTLPPSMVFAGPAGIGKRRVAFAVAEALNCLEPIRAGEFEIDACGVCASCRRIARGVHADVIVLEPGDTGSIKVDPVRAVIDRANYRPFEGRRRAVIVDQAEGLVDEAQNALLRTLEEPPAASVFILVSSMPELLLPTVRSRCRPLRFGELTPEEVAETLVRDHEYTASDARAAAAGAGGSIKRALEARGVDLTDARGAAHRVLQHAARVTDPARRLDAARELTGKGAAAAVEREQLAVCLRSLASLLRDLGRLAGRADTTMLANGDLQAEIGRLSGVFDGERSARAFDAVARALAALDRNVNPKVVADWVVLQL